MRTILIGALTTLTAGLLAAADVSGKWTAEMRRRGEPVKTTFVFKTEGEKLTGTVGGRRGDATLQDGKISGDKISFSTTARNAKILFEGTVAGDEIKMKRTREGGQTREFTLKREK